MASSLAWGGGDFAGGMGVRSVGGKVSGALRVVMLSHLISFVVLLVVAIGLGESGMGSAVPHGKILAWGLAAGVTSCISITAFYIALSRGRMGVAAAVSGLLAAAIPAVVSAWNDGSPGTMRLAGFTVAGVAIWLIAASDGSGKRDLIAVGLAIGAGTGFGLYFVALKIAGLAGPIWAMASMRLGSLLTCALLMLGLQLSSTWQPSSVMRATIGWVLMTALLDTSGNMLFIAATRTGRLDVAAVLASMYPAGTILLAGWMLRERPTRRQGWGMAVAAVAVVMITL